MISVNDHNNFLNNLKLLSRSVNLLPWVSALLREHGMCLTAVGAIRAPRGAEDCGSERVINEHDTSKQGRWGQLRCHLLYSYQHRWLLDLVLLTQRSLPVAMGWVREWDHSPYAFQLVIHS